MKRSLTESHLQRTLKQMLELLMPHLLWFAIPNGGYRNKFEAFNLKREGVKAGVADILVAEPSMNYHGLFLELKSASGVLSPEQKAFMTEVKKRGYAYEVARSPEEALETIRRYLRLTPCTN